MQFPSNLGSACVHVQHRVQFDPTMLFEPTILASVARLIGESLTAVYGVDPQPIFDELKIDTGKFHQPGARVSLTKLNMLWRNAVAASGDPFFGLTVGERVMLRSHRRPWG